MQEEDVRVINPLELELQEVVSSLTLAMEFKLRSSERGLLTNETSISSDLTSDF